MATATTLEDFRDEVVTFLDANASPKPAARKTFAWGEGPDDVTVWEELPIGPNGELLRAAKAWRARRYDAGLGWISGPARYGGRELSTEHDRLYRELEARYGVPDQSFFGGGVEIVAPAILVHGTERAKDTFLPAMFRGDLLGCQLFSEPGAGSDLASVTTRAERDGDEWILNGQKVWTSGAQFCDLGEVICRTDTDLPKHRGLSMFMLDLRAPGVEVRPLRQMTGGSSFNEVFLHDVRVPHWALLGDVNQGWTVTLTTLMIERTSMGTSTTLGGGEDELARLIAMVRHVGLAGDPLVRQEMGRIYTATKLAEYNTRQAMARLDRGRAPGPEMSLAKLALTAAMRRTSAFVSHALGPRLIADSGEWGTFAWSGYVTGVPGMSIAGGTDEVQRNIVAERVLGLPKEPGIDTTSPFKRLPTS